MKTWTAHLQWNEGEKTIGQSGVCFALIFPPTISFVSSVREWERRIEKDSPPFDGRPVIVLFFFFFCVLFLLSAFLPLFRLYPLSLTNLLSFFYTLSVLLTVKLSLLMRLIGKTLTSEFSWSHVCLLGEREASELIDLWPSNGQFDMLVPGLVVTHVVADGSACDSWNGQIRHVRC